MVLAGDGVGDNGVESRRPGGALLGTPGGALGVVDVVWALKAAELSGGEKADSSRAIGGAADGAGAIGEAVEFAGDGGDVGGVSGGRMALDGGEGGEGAGGGGAAAGVKPGVPG